jgi:hypothetical protein
MSDRITLHAEIEAIFSETDQDWLTTQEIADLVNARGRYHKGDGSPVSAFQIHGRTRNYPQLFDRDGSRVRLRRGDRGSRPASRSTTPPASPRAPAANPPSTSLVADALAALADPSVSVKEGGVAAPHQPGLYSIGATADGLADLGLDTQSKVLYIGKAERSLESRDLRQHFSDGQTGGSTLRRSVGALLAKELGLIAMPRNPTSPGAYDRYAFEPSSDRVLTEWMSQHLRLAFWAAPPGCILRPIEIAAIQHFAPPLNLTDVVTAHTGTIKAKRKLLADDARRWELRKR